MIDVQRETPEIIDLGPIAELTEGATDCGSDKVTSAIEHDPNDPS